MMRLWEEGGALFSEAGDVRSWTVAKCLSQEDGTETSLGISSKPQEASILLTEDFGKVLNLRKWIERLSQSPAAQGTATDAVSQVGSVIGHNLAKMHSQETYAKVMANRETSELLKLPLTDEVVWYLAMEPLPDLFAKYFAQGNTYYERLESDSKNPEMPYPPCLVHGDFNFGNIVVADPDSTSAQTGPFVLDWEFASGNGRGINGDVSEFLSILHCRIVIERSAADNTQAPLLRALCNSFAAAYREKAQLRCKMEPGDLVSHLYRSALLLAGRDMAVYAGYACDNDKERDEIMAIAGWYFDRAGKDIHEFLTASNQEALKEEDEGLFRSMIIFE